jgi:hypothetical protein
VRAEAPPRGAQYASSRTTPPSTEVESSVAGLGAQPRPPPTARRHRIGDAGWPFPTRGLGYLTAFGPVVGRAEAVRQAQAQGVVRNDVDPRVVVYLVLALVVTAQALPQLTQLILGTDATASLRAALNVFLAPVNAVPGTQRAEGSSASTLNLGWAR